MCEVNHEETELAFTLGVLVGHHHESVTNEYITDSQELPPLFDFVGVLVGPRHESVANECVTDSQKLPPLFDFVSKTETIFNMILMN